jgi:RNA polymerase sigma-70 factor (ECF subfamily)
LFEAISTPPPPRQKRVTTLDPLAGQPAEDVIPRLMDDYADHIYGLGLRMCDDPEKAQDLVQETFMRAFRSWASFDGRSKPSTWLYTIASRSCQRMERRRAGEPRHMRPLEELLPSGERTVVDIPSGRDTPLEWVERKDVVDAVRTAIDSLPIHFRLPLVLKEIEDLSVEDVARILGVKEATVKTRLHRARLLIRRALAVPLPQKPAPDGDSAEGACMDLLWAKQEALDRGVDFPIPEQHLCERCRSVFATLDLTGDVCHLLGDVKLPDEARRALEKRVMRERA